MLVFFLPQQWFDWQYSFRVEVLNHIGWYLGHKGLIAPAPDPPTYLFLNLSLPSGSYTIGNGNICIWGRGQCAQVPRKNTGAPVYTGICGKLPVFLWLCPSICDFWAHSECYWAVSQTGQLWSEHALNHKKTTKSQKLEFCPSLPPSNAHIFVQKMPVFL